MKTPCRNRHTISCQSDPAVAARNEAAASADAAPTMTRLRPTRSATRPATGAASATPSVLAVDGEAHLERGGLEGAREKRQERLRRVEIEERGGAGQDDG